MHELITHLAVPLPHLAFKNAFLKPFQEFRNLRDMTTHLTLHCMALQEIFLCSKPQCFTVWPHCAPSTWTCGWQQDTAAFRRSWGICFQEADSCAPGWRPQFLVMKPSLQGSLSALMTCQLPSTPRAGYPRGNREEVTGLWQACLRSYTLALPPYSVPWQWVTKCPLKGKRIRLHLLEGASENLNHQSSFPSNSSREGKQVLVTLWIKYQNVNKIPVCECSAEWLQGVKSLTS